MFTVRRPVGVWAAITPWNFPVMIPMEYVGPGLATGNAMIVKPPEFTCWALLEMAKVFDEAGAPKGAIKVIPGGGDIGESLVTHPGVDAIGFTGSSATGADRLADGAEALDHGDVGQWPDSSSPATAISSPRRRRLSTAPTTTPARSAAPPSGSIVLEEVHDEFVEATLKAAEVVRLGDPFDEATTMGPLNNEPHRRQDGPPPRGRPWSAAPRS